MLGSELTNLRRWTQHYKDQNNDKATYQFALKDYVWYPDGGNNLANYLKDTRLVQGSGIGQVLETLKDVFDTSKKIENTAAIYVHEFEPKDNLEQRIEKYVKLLEFFENLQFDNGSASFAALEKNLTKIFSLETWQKAIEDAIGGGLNSDDGIKLIHEIPAIFYQKLLAGRWIGKFELPYYGENFIHAQGNVGWKTRTLLDNLGGSGGLAGKVLEKTGLGNINIGTRPRFSLEDNGPMADPIDVEFHLYNETSENLAKNLDFLFTIVSGAFWVQSSFTQRASNLYHIYIPGRLLYFLCTLDIKVEYEGKTRRLGEDAFGRVLGAINNVNLIDAFANNENTDAYITPNALIPDGYKVTATFQSIIPNNYNTHAMIYFNESGLSSISNTIEVKPGDAIPDLVGAIFDNLSLDIQSQNLAEYKNMGLTDLATGATSNIA